jgi:hypothetical protein
MKIDFDNFRIQMAKAMNEITKLQNEDLLLHPEYSYHLFENLDDLRSYVGAIMCIYDPSQENFSDLSDFEILQVNED